MPDWLTSSSIGDSVPDPGVMLLRLGAAFLFGGVVAWIYRTSHGREHGSPGTLSATLVLLSILIAMVSMTIGNSVARAFSLVGALSIVRFRTVVDDTRDTAFVIFAVIVGMASGAGLLLLPVLGLPVVGLAAIGLSRWPQSNPSSAARCRLTVRLALGRDPELALGGILQRSLDDLQLMETSTARQGAALDLMYLGRLLPEQTLAQLTIDLNQVEGVMSVEIVRQ
jgi:hypothetical protein